MKFCTNCGTKLYDNDSFCTNCGCVASQTQPQAEITNSSHNYQTNHANLGLNSQNYQRPPKKSSPTKLAVIIAIIIAIIAIVIVSAIVLIATSCKHEWSEATCTEPQTCINCAETVGDAIGHKFNDATCTDPKTCSECGKTEGSALGHTEGNWTVTKNPTIISTGSEELFCTVCDKSLDSKILQKKSPKVETDKFNFTDKELIEWLNAETTATVSYTEIDVFDDDNPNTCYAITWQDGETGALILNHGDARTVTDKNGEINAIMIYYEETSYSIALAAWIGNAINSSFNTDDALENVYFNKSYISANMAMLRFELDDDFVVTLLSPYNYVLNLTD